MSNWSRAHDALLAEKAEGLKLLSFLNGGYYESWDGHTWRPVDHYDTDLAAIARAQEAWRKQDANMRAYTIRSPYVGLDYKWVCEIHGDGTGGGRGRELTEAAARAWALWRACGGAE